MDEPDPLSVTDKWRENIAANLSLVAHYADMANQACAASDDTLVMYATRKLGAYLDAAKASLVDLIEHTGTGAGGGRP